MVETAFDFMSIQWAAPYRLQAGSLSLNFEPPGEHLVDARPSVAKTLLKAKPIVKIMHSVRCFLRQSLCRAEALRRPKDFGDLEDGWRDQ